ncbi:MAG: EamA family transporter [Opitutales bacterium]
MGYLLLVSLIWAFPFGLVGELLKAGGVHLDALPVLRLGLALLVFLPLARIGSVATTTRWRLLVIGGVQYGLMYVLLFNAFHFLPAWQVALFTVFTPFYVAGIFDTLERRFDRGRFALALMAAVGAGVVVLQPGTALLTEGDASLAIGFALMQACNLCFAAGQVAYKRLRQHHAHLEDGGIYALVYLGAVAVSGVYALATWGLGTELIRPALIDAEGVWILLYLGVVSSGLCFFWWNRGATQVGPVTLAVFNNLKVPVSVAGTLLLFELGEGAQRPDPVRLLIGGALVVAALVLAERKSAKAAA